jgi:L-amino acid N-acyltransferase YncA
MQIRPADAVRDAAACTEIYGPFVRDTVVSLEERTPSVEEFGQRIELIGATHGWLIAELDGAVAGFAYASPHRARASYRWAADVSVYVDARYQRRGVGRSLYGALLARLVGQGLVIACAGITLPNSASVSLHESCGFQPVGVYRRIGFKQGAWRDVGWWQLALRPQDDNAPPPEPRPPDRSAGLTP